MYDCHFCKGKGKLAEWDGSERVCTGCGGEGKVSTVYLVGLVGIDLKLFAMSPLRAYRPNYLDNGEAFSFPRYSFKVKRGVAEEWTRRTTDGTDRAVARIADDELIAASAEADAEIARCEEALKAARAAKQDLLESHIPRLKLARKPVTT